MMPSDLTPLLFVALGAGAIGLQHRLSRAAQPLRLQLAESGEALLTEPNLPHEMQEQVRFLLDTAFGFRWGMILSLIALPFLAVAIVTRRRLFALFTRSYLGLEPSLRQRFDDFSKLHDRVTLANHPLLFFVMEAEILCLVSTANLISGVFRGRFPVSLNREYMMNFVETDPRRLRRLLSA